MHTYSSRLLKAEDAPGRGLKALNGVKKEFLCIELGPAC